MMDVRESLKVLSRVRGHNDVVITNQGSARIWPLISSHRFDFQYNPSTMGGAIPLALGIALAKADREVIVVSGDGALLMSLGSLVSVIGSGVRNLTVVLLENGIYEVTGGQRTAANGTAIDFAAIASGSGFAVARSFDDLPSWTQDAETIFAVQGPRFINLKVAAADQQDLKTPPESASMQIQRFRESLAKN
ncbi:MAG: thiamine pyrophosphate-dependent enzyme [Pirellulaceae bacterium]|nr:thiamine pyrophosphate-dependent enzyme [Pirellulaceae bacterium]